ncbi:MAG TPA: hypothetical protein EYP85_03775 [Armatimonadetes bacterium]|nr:hypothetical protein [Armatimonadota bacterium]
MHASEHRNVQHAPVTKAVIPAAGRGTRLRPATKSQPKEMLPVGRKPTIQYVVEELFTAGLEDIIIITGWYKRAIEDHFDLNHGADLETEPFLSNDVFRGRDLNRHLFYVRQRRQAGLADAVLHGSAFVGKEPFVVALGDTIIYTPQGVPLVKRLIEAHRAIGAAATIAVEPVRPEEVKKYGIVAPKAETEGVFEIVDIIEKPSPQEAPSHFAVASRYVFEAVIFDMIRRIGPGVGGELQLTDAIRLLLREGYPVWCVRLAPDEIRYDIGNFVTYYRAFIDMALRDPEVGPKIGAYLRTVVTTSER